MAETEVTIQLPADAPADLIARIRSAFPDAAISRPGGEGARADAVFSVSDAIRRGAAALPEIPGKMAEVWTGFGGGFQPLLAFALVLAVGTVAEFIVRGLWRRRQSTTNLDMDFHARASRALVQYLRAFIGLAVFAVAASIASSTVASGNVASVQALRCVTDSIVFVRAVPICFDGLLAPADGYPALGGVHGRRGCALRGRGPHLRGDSRREGLLMAQSRTMSLVEAVTNVVAGFSIVISVQLDIFPFDGLAVRFGDTLGIAAIFTAVSIVRSYLLGRLFECIAGRDE